MGFIVITRSIHIHKYNDLIAEKFKYLRRDYCISFFTVKLLVLGVPRRPYLLRLFLSVCLFLFVSLSLRVAYYELVKFITGCLETKKPGRGEVQNYIRAKRIFIIVKRRIERARRATTWIMFCLLNGHSICRRYTYDYVWYKRYVSRT